MAALCLSPCSPHHCTLPPARAATAWAASASRTACPRPAKATAPPASNRLPHESRDRRSRGGGGAGRGEAVGAQASGRGGSGGSGLAGLVAAPPAASPPIAAASLAMTAAAAAADVHRSSRAAMTAARAVV